MDLGQVAYEAYVEHCGGKSIRGDDLPSWDGQSPAIREHWEAAAEARGERAHPVTETRAEVREPFIDDVGGGWCELVVPPGGKIYPQDGEPKIGIAHPRCISIADLAIDFDAFFCSTCKRNGRVSGAWCADVIEAALGS